MKRLVSKYWFYIAITFIVTTIASFSLFRVLRLKPDIDLADNNTVVKTNKDESNETSETSDDESLDNISTENSTPTFINLQPTIDSWLKTIDGDVGIVIYDFDNNRIAASYQPDIPFNSASLYKLFFAYDGYRQIDTGKINAEDIYVTTNDYRADTYSYGNCLDLIIRESYNGCADIMYSDLEIDQRITAMIESELELKSTKINGLISTASDLTVLLKKYYYHPDLTADSWSKLSDSMLNQPTTIENWRQGLPAGFKTADVYAKVGWNYDGTNWTIYNEAALLVFPNLNRHYSIVVLTEGLSSFEPLTKLGTMIENAILSTDNT